VIRDFSDVRFVVEAYRRLLDSNIAEETVNICSPEFDSLPFNIVTVFK
jgi:hypothetical protein